MHETQELATHWSGPVNRLVDRHRKWGGWARELCGIQGLFCS